MLYMFDLKFFFVTLGNVAPYTFTADWDDLLQNHCLNGKGILNFMLKICLEEQRLNELQNQPTLNNFFPL